MAHRSRPHQLCRPHGATSALTVPSTGYRQHDCLDGSVEVLARVRGADLAAETRRALWDDGEAEPRHVNAAPQELRGHGDGLGCVADEDRNDRRNPLAHLHATPRQPGGEARRTLKKAAGE